MAAYPGKHWIVYKVQFEIASSFNGWILAKQVANLMMLLCGKVAGLLRSLLAATWDLTVNGSIGITLMPLDTSKTYTDAN